MSGAPDVSVVVPYLRAAATIERAIASALRQIGVSVEVIAVSDGSSDGSSAVVARIAAADARVRPIALPTNRGPSAARNAGMSAASGRWVAVLDGDDAFVPDRLATMLAAAGDAAVVVDNLMGIDPSDAEETGVVYGALPALLTVRDIVATDAPASAYNYGYLKPVYRRDVVAEHAIRYDEALRTGEDMVFLAECALVAGPIVAVDQPSYRYTLQVSPKDRSISAMSHSLPVDREVAAALTRLAARRDDRFDAVARSAVAARIDDLHRYADVSMFRHLLHRKAALPALSLLVRSAEVRRYARRFVARKIGASGEAGRA